MAIMDEVVANNGRDSDNNEGEKERVRDGEAEVEGRG